MRYKIKFSDGTEIITKADSELEAVRIAKRIGMSLYDTAMANRMWGMMTPSKKREISKMAKNSDFEKFLLDIVLEAPGIAYLDTQSMVAYYQLAKKYVE